MGLLRLLGFLTILGLMLCRGGCRFLVICICCNVYFDFGGCDIISVGNIVVLGR